MVAKNMVSAARLPGSQFSSSRTNGRTLDKTSPLISSQFPQWRDNEIDLLGWLWPLHHVTHM